MQTITNCNISHQESRKYKYQTSVQTSEEEEGKGDRDDKEEVNEDKDGEGVGEDTCKEGEGEVGEEDKHCTISLSNNNHFYVITIREQRQLAKMTVHCKNYNNY